MSDIVKVLSIDGGGIRGVIPAVVLAEIEARTKKPICELFHLIAGTSTGGLLALALTKPDESGKPEYSAQQIVELYEKEGEQIFSRSVLHKIRSIGSLMEEKYTVDGIEDVLNRYFKETQLKESLTDVLITSYEIEQRVPWLFKSSRAKTDGNYDFPMWQVARATTAAPTYFEPYKVGVDDASGYYALIDGGICANNPAMCAYVEAKNTYPDNDNCLIISLGTGQICRPLLYDKVRDWGMAAWAQPLLSLFFDGACRTVDYQLRQLLSNRDGSPRYYRLQGRLDEGHAGMDDSSAMNIRMLKLLAEDIIRDNGDNLNRLCEQLIE